MNIRKALYFSAWRLLGSSLGQQYEAMLKEDQERTGSDLVPARLAQLLAHCERAVPYYRDLLRDPGGAFDPQRPPDLAQLPLLTKALIRQNFDRLQSADLPQRKWSFNTSGGSTGEPVRFIQDQEYRDRQMAVQLLSFKWAGRELGQPTVRIWGSERDVLRGSMGVRMKFYNNLTQDKWFNAFRMTPENVRALLRELNANPPRLIVAYAQAVYEVAKFAEHEKIRMAPQSAILTSAGTLYPFMREKLEAVFGCQVFNRYGSREVGDIACECEAHAGLHVFPWASYVEIVDDNGAPVPRATEGNIVVTCLSNYAMPLIRYAIGDRGVLSPDETCACGRRGQILQKVSGRNVDTFKTSQRVLVDGEYFTHLMYFRPWVNKFQVVQKSPNLIQFRVVKTGAGADPGELDEITDKVKVLMGAECKVAFDFVDEIPPTASGKYRYTISEVPE